MEIHNYKKVVPLNACKFCGKPLKDEWKFCPYCRTSVETMRCIFCGQEIRSNWNYCPSCKKGVKDEIKNRQRVDNSNEWLREILKK